jgi:hypothetical protein
VTRARRRRWIAAWTVGGAVVLATVLVQPRDSPQTCRSALIPAYVPSQELAALAELPPRRRLVIVNPASGPGAAPDPRYQSAIRTLQRSGGAVLGYVPTGYGGRPTADVRADIDRYRDWYGVDGIFLDEASASARDVPRYRGLVEHARAATGRPVVLNPGVEPAPGYFEIADIVVTFEGAYADYRAALARGAGDGDGVDARRRAALVYGASRAQALDAVDRAGETGFLYVTSGTLPNPWQTLPPYLAELEEAIVTSTPAARPRGGDACAST